MNWRKSSTFTRQPREENSIPYFQSSSKRFGSTGNDQGYSVSADESGNVFVTGGLKGTVNFGGSDLTSAGSWDAFVAKFGP
jgi:hypothetical protein